MAATFIRESESIPLDVKVEIDGPSKALVSGPAAGAFQAVLMRWAAGGNYVTTEFDIQSEELLLEGCSYYSSEPAGGFHVTFRNAL